MVWWFLILSPPPQLYIIMMLLCGICEPEVILITILHQPVTTLYINTKPSVLEFGGGCDGLGPSLRDFISGETSLLGWGCVPLLQGCVMLVSLVHLLSLLVKRNNAAWGMCSVLCLSSSSLLTRGRYLCDRMLQ